MSELVSAPLLALAALNTASLAVCGGAVLLVIAICCVRFGSSARLALGDLALVGLCELAWPIVLRSPLDLAHLRGYAFAQWSVALGTAVAILGVLVNHQAHH